MAYRYFPYEGNGHHELRIAPGSVPGDVELVALASNRNASVVIKAADLETVINEIRAAAGGPES